MTTDALPRPNERQGGTELFYPASFANVIAVAATDHNDVKASCSQHGSWIDVAAPGENTLSTAPDHFNNLFLFPFGYFTASGTSMASPHVAGIAGLVWSTGLCADNARVRDRIEQRADAIPGTGQFWTYGRVNAYKSVSAAASPADPPVVSSVAPSSGIPAGDTQVTISGLGFSTQPGSTLVHFGANQAKLSVAALARPRHRPGPAQST